MNNDFLPYSRQRIEEEDIEAVVEALRSPMISQGSRLEQFEQEFASATQSDFAVGFSSGSAAIHGMCSAAAIGLGDEVILPALTFASTANAVLHLGGRPVFVDVDPISRCLDPRAVESAITERTKAVLAVDFGGHPAPYDELRAITDAHDLRLLADSAHSVGGRFRDRPIGSIADLTAFSFNPVKNMTTAEGGMVTTRDGHIATHLRMFRVHGMTREPDVLESDSPGGWYYEQQFLGLNYKLSELHAALGIAQLRRVDRFNRRRAEIAARYTALLRDHPFQLPEPPADGLHTWHIYVVQTNNAESRARVFSAMRDAGIGVQVHYIPIPMHPFFVRLGYTMDDLPVTAAYYDRALSIPCHPLMTDEDVERVVRALDQA